jgi:16S rRNA (guanine527-N7)-methyltransferase
MDTVRIADLLKPFLDQSLPESQLDQISIYIDLLLRWNARINLTAIRHPEEIVTRHFGESFFLARHLFPQVPPDSASIPAAESAPSKLRLGGDVRSSTGYWVPDTGHSTPHVLDIGSGAGFPALPLKLWAPHIHLTLIESNHRKAAFLREVSRELGLTGIHVLTDRAETVADRQDFPRAQLVTLRAVEHFEKILPKAAAFLAPNGILALLIGSAQLPHLTTLTTLKWSPPIPIPQSHTRVLSIGEHV